MSTYYLQRYKSDQSGKGPQTWHLPKALLIQQCLLSAFSVTPAPRQFSPAWKNIHVTITV